MSDFDYLRDGPVIKPRERGTKIRARGVEKYDLQRTGFVDYAARPGDLGGLKRRSR